MCHNATLCWLLHCALCPLFVVTCVRGLALTTEQRSAVWLYHLFSRKGIWISAAKTTIRWHARAPITVSQVLALFGWVSRREITIADKYMFVRINWFSWDASSVQRALNKMGVHLSATE